MLNNWNIIKIKIIFEGNIKELNCFYNATIKEIITKFINEFLNHNFKLKYFSLTINNKKCILEKTLETYRNDIYNNNIFLLTYNYNEANNEKNKQLNKTNFMPNILLGNNYNGNYNFNNIYNNNNNYYYQNNYNNSNSFNNYNNCYINNTLFSNNNFNNYNNYGYNKINNNIINNNIINNNQMIKKNINNNFNPMLMNNYMKMNNNIMNNCNNICIKDNKKKQIKDLIPKKEKEDENENKHEYLYVQECYIDKQILNKSNEKKSHILSLGEEKFFNMEINIKFFRSGNINKFLQNSIIDLHGLLKLCLLKEISICEEFEQIEGLPEHISNIMQILKNGKIKYNGIKSGIQEILKKIKGGNILNFSKYVDNLITTKEINNYLIPKLKNSKNNIFYIQNYLCQYIEYSKAFEREFDRAKKDSVFEYSIIAAGIIERDDILKFEKNRIKCPNRVDRILFHGTSYDAISSILPDVFRISKYSAQHGKGVYFTQDLDSCWIYESEEKSNKKNTDERRNLNIPQAANICLL